MARVLIVEDNELNRDMLSRRRARRRSEVLVAREIERLIGKIERWIPRAPP